MNGRYALFAILPVLLSAGDPPSERSASIDALEETFLASSCYSEPLSKHRSEVALQMKAEIARLVDESNSDHEIIDTYKKRYGARVFVEPEGSQWWWMHVVPWAVLLLGLAFTVRLMRRMSGRKGLPQAADASDLYL